MKKTLFTLAVLLSSALASFAQPASVPAVKSDATDVYQLYVNGGKTAFILIVGTEQHSLKRPSTARRSRKKMPSNGQGASLRVWMSMRRNTSTLTSILCRT